MVWNWSIISAAALFSSSISASNVIDLTLDNFDQVIGKGIPALVEFYAPWCGHCKNLAPTFEQLADEFVHAKDKVIVAKVDADQHKDLGKRFGIKGFPTLKWFDNSAKDPQDYDKGRDFESLSQFIMERAGVKIKPKQTSRSEVIILTDENFYSIVMDPQKDVFVKFYTTWCGHCQKLAPEYDNLANDMIGEPNIVIAKVDCTVHTALCEQHGVQGYPTLKFFPRGPSKTPVGYSGERTEAGILSFINANAGTNRQIGGTLGSQAGRIAELDELATIFMETKSKDIISEAKKVSENNPSSHANYYLKVFEKITTKPSYVNDEGLRLDNILAKGSLALSKADDFQVRRNILKAFEVFESEKPAKDEL
ncbi:Protein disulfide-isomerase tigA [Neolecta irregularis DAH-3]|uniref:protein disulfide-isomerase n=1 Tax=Neolecta irregularis (strain DAH-3) TaxID=1198029 RepID=A0A1U7LQI2_NEOID|nr:Protein disulfide-isomerase tigA [Neolecta irregularis DAH-3]|eukprot:OLL24904.1 Protein disulfide-isomerase tigA [Neolecta irregularis DAH-3]